MIYRIKYNIYKILKYKRKPTMIYKCLMTTNFVYLKINKILINNLINYKKIMNKIIMNKIIKYNIKKVLYF